MRSSLARRSFLTLAAAAAVAPSRVGAQAPTQLACASSPDDDVSPFLYALRAGLFRREGLDVTFRASNSGAAVAAAVVGNSVGIGKSSVMALIAARSRGIPFVLVAPAGLYTSDNPIITMLVRDDSPIRSPRDLDGKTISVPSIGDLYAVAAEAMIDRAGGDSHSAHFLELPSSAAPAALADRRIDAVSLTTPILVTMLASKQFRAVGHPFDAIASRFIQAAWFTTADFAAKNKATIERFARAMHEASAYSNAHHAETVDDLAEATHIDRNVIAHMPRSNAALTLDPALIQPVIDAAAKYKAIAAPFDAKTMIYEGA